MSSRNLGILQIILSGVCFGFLGIFGKTLYENGVVPGELLALRFVIAASISFVYLALVDRKILLLKGRQILSCALLGAGGYAVFSFCYFSALEGLSASLTVLLLYTYPVMVTVFAYLFLGETIARRHWIALPFALIGLIGLVWGDFTVDRAEYLFFGVMAAVLYSAYILLSARLLKGLSPKVTSPYIQLFAGLLLGSIYLTDTLRVEKIVLENWPVLLGISLICTIAAIGLFLAGLQKLKGWEVSVLSTTEPLTSILLATLLLGESLTLVQGISSVAVIFALIWVSIPVKLHSQGLEKSL